MLRRRTRQTARRPDACAASKRVADNTGVGRQRPTLFCALLFLPGPGRWLAAGETEGKRSRAELFGSAISLPLHHFVVPLPVSGRIFMRPRTRRGRTLADPPSAPALDAAFSGKGIGRVALSAPSPRKNGILVTPRHEGRGVFPGAGFGRVALTLPNPGKLLKTRVVLGGFGYLQQRIAVDDLHPALLQLDQPGIRPGRQLSINLFA